MSTELINRITVKKDGVYLSSHSSNDTAPFHAWRCNSLSEIYAAEGQAGLDREIVCIKKSCLSMWCLLQRHITKFIICLCHREVGFLIRKQKNPFVWL